VYFVTITDNTGCSQTISTSLTDPDALQLAGVITDASCLSCPNGAIDVTVTGGTSTYSYLWSNGETTEDLQNISAGFYEVCITDANLCTFCDSFTVLEPATGVLNLNSTSGITVYPNPFTDFTTIHINNTAQEVTDLIVYSVSGSIVYREVFTGSEFKLNSNTIGSGYYFLQLKNTKGNILQTTPLIIE
jgi:hypothetical protein